MGLTSVSVTDKKNKLKPLILKQKERMQHDSPLRLQETRDGI